MSDDIVKRLEAEVTVHFGTTDGRPRGWRRRPSSVGDWVDVTA